MTAQGDRYSVDVHGSVWFSAEDWAALSSWAQGKLVEDARRNGGGYPRLGLAFVHASAKAATMQAAFPNTVSTAKPQTVAHGKMISVAEAASRRGCSEQLLRRLARRGDIRAYRMGRVWLIDESQFPAEPEEG
ncbi:excisionase family DNA-binding protein [Sinomonas sp. JGH33]|uniref:Excisionase family DNA-binding protein n=1 Tax=Sinomonas terricola TaxID=3110330 RepID=A0ABU5T1R3_9MICC|nr:excisionase family DNA-binding protein [Sinomonas sp. JGH33]MEA5453585.1 excisionase family DNA-binding protein [Sinomonas sp. JGH33]